MLQGKNPTLCDFNKYQLDTTAYNLVAKSALYPFTLSQDAQNACDMEIIHLFQLPD